jgi:hypothetical protein
VFVLLGGVDADEAPMRVERSERPAPSSQMVA